MNQLEKWINYKWICPQNKINMFILLMLNMLYRYIDTHRNRESDKQTYRHANRRTKRPREGDALSGDASMLNPVSVAKFNEVIDSENKYHTGIAEVKGQHTTLGPKTPGSAWQDMMSYPVSTFSLNVTLDTENSYCVSIM